MEPLVPVGRERAPDGLPDELFRHIEEVSGLGTWMWDPRSDLVAWSDQVHRIFGTNPADESPTFESYARLVHPDDVEQVLTRAREAVLSGSSYAIDHRIIRPDGETREIHSKGRAEVGADGQVTFLAGSVQDVTAARKASRELARARDLFAGVLDAATEQSIIGMDEDGIITVFNKGAERMLGYRASELVGLRSPLILHDPAEIARRADELHIAPDFTVLVGNAMSGRAETRRWTYITKDGRRLQAMITASAMHGPDGRITGFIKVGTDLTARFVAEQALQDSEAMFEEIFDNAGTGIMLVGIAQREARLMRVNPAMARITGYSEPQLLQMSVFELTHPDSLAAAKDRMLQYFADGGAEPAEAERRWIHADGREIWVQLNISPTRRDHPETVVALVSNITARKSAESRLSHLALHDALTGLPNRRLLFDRLQHALDASSRSGRPAGVLYVDLDGFKSVNDQAGHLVGDEILKVAAQRLVGNVRPGDTVARMGGDEFVVLCPDLADPDDVHTVARRLLRQLARPYSSAASTHRLSASIGMASATAGASAQALIREADEAMYRAKQAGRNRIRRSDLTAPAAALPAQVNRLTERGEDLNRAAQRDQPVRYGQPVVGPDTGVDVPAEA